MKKHVLLFALLWFVLGVGLAQENDDTDHKSDSLTLDQKRLLVKQMLEELFDLDMAQQAIKIRNI